MFCIQPSALCHAIELSCMVSMSRVCTAACGCVYSRAYMHLSWCPYQQQPWNIESMACASLGTQPMFAVMSSDCVYLLYRQLLKWQQLSTLLGRILLLGLVCNS